MGNGKFSDDVKSVLFFLHVLDDDISVLSWFHIFWPVLGAFHLYVRRTLMFHQKTCPQYISDLKREEIINSFRFDVKKKFKVFIKNVLINPNFLSVFYTLTYFHSLFQVGQHHNLCNLLLPDHCPEVVKCVLFRT